MNNTIDDTLAQVAKRNQKATNESNSNMDEEITSCSMLAAGKKKDAKKSTEMYGTSPCHTPRKECWSDAPPKDPKRKPKQNPLFKDCKELNILQRQ